MAPRIYAERSEVPLKAALKATVPSYHTHRAGEGSASAPYTAPPGHMALASALDSCSPPCPIIIIQFIINILIYCTREFTGCALQSAT